MPTGLLFTDDIGLWALDPTTGTVALLASIAGDVNGVSYQAGSLAISGNRAYFAGGDANDPLGLYVSDGTAAGTKLVVNFPANGSSTATIADLTALSGGGAVFVFFDSTGAQTLWTTNGTTVTEVTTIGGGSYGDTSGGFPAINLGPGQSGEVGGHLLFTDATGLWSLNEATSQITRLGSVVGDVNGVGYQAGSLAVSGGQAYFTGGDANAPLGLYVSDGTVVGTRLVQNFPANGSSTATIADLTALSGGGAVFVFLDSTGAQTLWTTDGTTVTEVTKVGGGFYGDTSGVFPAINLGPGQSGEIVGHLLFTDANGVWSLNEATSQVTLLASVVGDVNGVSYQAGSLAVSGGKAYFAGDDANDPLGLYVSDGTAAGTKLITTFRPGDGPSPATIADLTALPGGGAVFVYFDDTGTQTLWTTNGTTVTEVGERGGGTYSETSGVFPSINLGPGQSGTVTPCYRRGTLIRTDRGDVAVENLGPGDVAATRDGDLSVVWIGHRRVDIARHPHPELVRPIRLAPGALGDAIPSRALFVSPDHGLLIDGVLIAARQLVNGVSVAIENVGWVDYYHVELTQHGILFAEGAPAESYLDTGNRAQFENAGRAIALHADFSRTTDAGACASLATDEATVRPIWQRIAARAGVSAADAPATTRDPDLRLVLRRGRTLRPLRVHANGDHVFKLTDDNGRARDLAGARLWSNHASPADLRPWLDDRRQLGVLVTSIAVWAESVADGPHALALDALPTAAGWWRADGGDITGRRWTDGDAALELPPGSRRLVVRVGAVADYFARGGPAAQGFSGDRAQSNRGSLAVTSASIAAARARTLSSGATGLHRFGAGRIASKRAD